MLLKNFDAQHCETELYLCCKTCRKGYVVSHEITASELLELNEHLEIHKNQLVEQ